MTDRSAIRFDLRSAVWVVVAVLSALGMFAIFRNARTPLTQISIGIVIALALDPLVSATRRRLGVRRGLAVALVGFTMMGIGSAAVVFLGPPARDQAGRFTRELPETVREFEQLPVIGDLVERYEVQRRVNEWVDKLPDRLDDQAVQRTFNRLVSNAFGLIVVGATAIAVLLDGERLIARFRRLFRQNPERLERIDRIGRVLYLTLGQYFGGSLTVAVLMGIVVLTIALSMGIPLAPVAALWAMFTNLIPQVGGFLGGSFLVLLALSKGPMQAIIAGAIFVVYMNIENHVLQPAIIGESVNLTPPTTMLAAFIGGAVAGLPGALVATPLVGAFKRLYLEFRSGTPLHVERIGFFGRLKLVTRKFRRKPLA